jgi:glycine/D-amino acid oxidase-like deaminating enzyme
VVVVGAGVTGLITAVRCARDGHRVTVLDRGAIPNAECTSADQHRALRALDPADVPGSRAAGEVHRHWLELRSLLGEPFYRPVGVVTACPAADLGAVLAAAAAAGLPVTPVRPGDLPHLRFPAGSAGVREAEAGVLLADRVLAAAARWLAAHPAVTLRPGCPARAVDADFGRVTLAGGEVVAGDLVLVAAGPWSGALVDLPLVLHRQTVVYLQPPEHLRRWWESAPSAGGLGPDGRGWLLPPDRSTLLKISTAAACREATALSEEDDEEPWVERVLAAGILTTPREYRVVATKRCHYQVDAATGAGRLSRIGPAGWARAASGGDGFRTAPLIADRIATALRSAHVVS